MKIFPVKLKKLFLFISIGFTMGVQAQKEWSLEECIDYALAYNLSIKDANYNESAHKEIYTQSIRELLPTVSGYADYSIRYGRSVDPNDNSITNSSFFSNNYYLNGSLDLFQGFKKLNILRASNLLYKAAKEDILQQKFLLLFSVMNAYYDIVFYEGLVTIAKELVEISKSNYKLTKKQIDLGLKAGADLYEAESALLKDELVLTRHKNQLKTAKLKLMQEMNYKEADSLVIIPIAIANPFTDTKIQSTDSVFNIAKKTVPLLKAQGFRVEAAQKQLAVERGNYYPSFSLFASYGSGYFETNVDAEDVTKPFRTQIDENMSSTVGLSVNIPIFDRATVRSRVKQQKIALLRAKNNLEIQEQVLFQEIQQLILENNALKTEFSQSSTQVMVQEQTFKIAQKKYENGLMNIIGLNQAKTLYAISKNDHLQVYLKLQINNSILDFYNGAPIVNALIKP